ncbi:MAG: TIGR04283 family arsenosugar biosynthesis glycosyltransferase [Pseudomonadota bacterium]
MPAPISVVIPTLNAAHALPSALEALIEGLDAGLLRDLVVSDGGSSDATLAIADAAGAKTVRGLPGRGAQIARGVGACSGDWILILHADGWLDPGWTGEVRAHIEAAPDRAAYFRLAFRAEGAMPRWVARWANLRSRLFNLPYGDQGLLVSRSSLACVGGVPDLPLMEDVALARALKGRLVPLRSQITTSADRYERDGWIARGARNLSLLGRYALGADPADLAKRYGPGSAAIDPQDRSG